MGYALWMDGETVNALLGRQVHVAGSFFNSGNGQVAGGCLPSGGGLAVSAGSGMSVNVSTGYAVIPSSSGSTYGGYLGAAMSATSGLTVATSDPVNPRIDLVCATVSDVGTSSSYWELQVITGTPAASPAAPALPSNSIPLASVLVPAGSTNVSGGNITDARIFVAGQGGIIPVRNLGAALSALASAGYEGLYVHDQATHRLVHYNGSGAQKVPVLLPWQPVLARRTTSVGSVSTAQTCLTAAITTDGSTDIEVYFQCCGIESSASATPFGGTFVLKLDSSVLTAAQAPLNSLAGGAFAVWGATTIHHVTSGAGGDTPSAGSHTVEVDFIGGGDGIHTIYAYAAAGQPMQLWVRPVPQ